MFVPYLNDNTLLYTRGDKRTETAEAPSTEPSINV